LPSAKVHKLGKFKEFLDVSKVLLGDVAVSEKVFNEGGIVADEEVLDVEDLHILLEGLEAKLSNPFYGLGLLLCLEFVF